MGTDRTDDPAGNRTDASGLRYVRKSSGSPFDGDIRLGGLTMSCFLCSRHRARKDLKARRMLGRICYVCAPSCQALHGQAAAAGGA